MANAAFWLVLWSLGQSISQGSRIMPSVRAQITRTLVFQLSAGDRVARHWIFDAQSRKATSHAGRAAHTDCSVHFSTSWEGFRALTSPRAVDKIVTGIHHGTILLDGSAYVLLWFYGLSRKFIKLGRASGPRYRVPDPYLAHDPAACGAETIVIEPAVVRLDPEWTAAWKARSTLVHVRACIDEPVLEP
jgi:hypothetical protein